MNQQQFPDNNVVLYDEDKWNIVEQKATIILNSINTKPISELHPLVMDFLNSHQEAVNVPYMGNLRRSIQSLRNANDLKTAIYELMDKSRLSIQDISALDSDNSR